MAASNTTPQEWRDAYVRSITLNDGQPATLLLMNTKDTLNVGLSYPHGNNGSPNQVTLYFEQVCGGGSHDDALTGTANEQAIRSNRTTVTDLTLEWSRFPRRLQLSPGRGHHAGAESPADLRVSIDAFVRRAGRRGGQLGEERRSERRMGGSTHGSVRS